MAARLRLPRAPRPGLCKAAWAPWCLAGTQGAEGCSLPVWWLAPLGAGQNGLGRYRTAGVFWFQEAVQATGSTVCLVWVQLARPAAPDEPGPRAVPGPLAQPLPACSPLSRSLPRPPAPRAASRPASPPGARSSGRDRAHGVLRPTCPNPARSYILTGQPRELLGGPCTAHVTTPTARTAVRPRYVCVRVPVHLP